jgi:hypothetical protein
MEANKKLTAKARISEKLSKVDVRMQDKEYAKAGRVSTAKSKMEQMLAARRLEKEKEIGIKEEKTKDEDYRPKI